MKKKPKVDAWLIERAKKMRMEGRRQDEIAVELGVSQSAISVILRSAGLGGKLIRKPSIFTSLARGLRKAG